LLGSARPVHSRLTRGQSAGPPPGARPGRGGASPGPCPGPALLAPAGSVLGSRRGPSSAWLRPRFSPAFPGPAHNEGSGSSGGSLSCRPGLAPRASCGASFGGQHSETWPGGFAQAGQSRGPGTDRPGSSTRALLPRPRVTPGGDIAGINNKLHGLASSFVHKIKLLCFSVSSLVDGQNLDSGPPSDNTISWEDDPRS
jgi:hypothetical protein